MKLFDFFKKQDMAQSEVIENAWRLFWLFWEYGRSIDITSTLLYDLYYKSTDVNAWIRDKSLLIFKDWFYLTDDTWEKIKRPEIRAVFNNRNQRFVDLIKQIITHYDISWNAFILKLRNAFGKLVWFQVLDSRTIKIISDEQWNISKYQQTIWLNGNSNNTYEWDPEDIIHWKWDVNPNEPLFGKSRLYGAAVDILADNEAAKTNMAYFKNNAVPASLIIFKDWVNKETIEALIKKMKKEFSWSNNKHKMGALLWVDKIIQLQNSLKDMEYKLLREFTTDIVCTSLGVPKTRMNKYNAAYSNMDDAYKQYIDATIRPYERDLWELFTEVIFEEFDENIIFAWNDYHTVDEKAKTEIAIMRVNNWLQTRNEAIKDLWLPESTEEEANKLTTQNNQIFLEDIWMQGLDPIVNE